MIISALQNGAMGLREEHRELTRQKALSAVLELVAEGSLDELSVPAVSRRSGVSVATIYRYFRNRDQLLAAAAAEPSRRTLASPGQPARGEADDAFTHYVRVMWHEFSDNLPLLRHQISSEAGREMRRARVDEGRRRLARYIEGFGVDPASETGQRLISTIMVMTGSVALIELLDRQGLGVDEAIENSLWAVRTLIDASGGHRQPRSAVDSREFQRSGS
jgi:AcrR family transcriptional regulator